MRRRVDPVARDVHAGQLGRDLVVTERAKRPADVRELQRAEDDQEGDEETREEVVAADVVVGEARGGMPSTTRPVSASRELALAEEQVREREREDERDDAGEDDTERSAHRDPAQEPTDDRRARRPTATPAAIGQRRWSDEHRRPVATDPGESADAEEELVRAPEDQVEADAVRREHHRLHGERRRVRRVAEPDATAGSRAPRAVTTIGSSAQPTLRVESRHRSYRPRRPRGRMRMVRAAAPRRMIVVMYCPM